MNHFGTYNDPNYVNDRETLNSDRDWHVIEDPLDNDHNEEATFQPVKGSNICAYEANE